MRVRDQFAAFCFGRRELLDGLDEGNEESESSVRERNGENPRERGGTHSGTGNGLGNGAGELNEVQSLLLNPWQLLLHFHFHFHFLLFLFLLLRSVVDGVWRG